MKEVDETSLTLQVVTNLWRPFTDNYRTTLFKRRTPIHMLQSKVTRRNCRIPYSASIRRERSTDVEAHTHRQFSEPQYAACIHVVSIEGPWLLGKAREPKALGKVRFAAGWHRPSDSA